MYYGARFYEPALGRFISPDSLVPGVLSPSKGEPGDPSHRDSLRSQSLNRYAYSNNNPLRYTDPTGMFSEDEIMKYYGVKTWDEVLAQFEEGGQYAGQWGWLEVLRNAHLNDSVAFSGADRDRPGHEIFRGRFTEDDNGNLMITDNQGTMNDAGTVFHSYPHYLMTLYRDSLPGAAVTVENNYVGSWQANTQYLHLKSVDWNSLLDPVATEHLVASAGITIFTFGLTLAYTAGAVALCVEPATCAGGVVMGINAGASATATFFLGKGTAALIEHHWRESTIYGP